MGNGNCRSWTGNGRPDLLLRDQESGDVFIRQHSGAFDGLNTFLPPVKIAENLGWPRFFFLRPLDSGNGRADLLAFSIAEINPGEGEHGEHGLYLLRNNGLNGLETLGEPLRISGKRDDKEWETLAAADVSGTGCDDTVSREKDAGHVDWFRHVGQVLPNDTWDKTPRRLTTVDVDDFPLAMADVTGNGKLDLVVLRSNGDLDVFVFADDHDFATAEGAGEGTWYTVARGWNEYRIIASTDIDLDGRPDLLTLRHDGTLLAHRHSGSFDPRRPLETFEKPVPVAEDCWRYDVIS
ncbi:VCBS repeat-containing protein [Streptomyces caatingaensis]|uniref:Alpha integrin n=1 Tax=Streptomyces caatingaensis TaxID=1678637 RepID=A0A0K9XCJ6_9ACTN|nr:VCBS repeat-containing protein [Streptomyces caatingaensis]KNB50928.1 hypothetical protein AC230_19295 [Streptomyces caatingaensis]